MQRYLPARLLAPVLFLASTLSAAAPAHLFILSGQSNMARLDPTRSFTPAVEAAFGAENVVVVKDAQGGKPIRRWLVSDVEDRISEMGDRSSNIEYRRSDVGLSAVALAAEAEDRISEFGDRSLDVEDRMSACPPKPEKRRRERGDLYERLMGKVRPVLAEREFETVTFVWMQGERDAGEGNADRYAADLLQLVRQLETDLDRDDLHVVIGRLSDFDLENKLYRHWTRIRTIQEELAEARPNWVWVDTDPYNGPEDGLHHTPGGYDALGQAFAEAAMGLISEFGD